MLLTVRVLVVEATAAYRRDELDELGTTGCMCASGSAALRACAVSVATLLMHIDDSGCSFCLYGTV